MKFLCLGYFDKDKMDACTQDDIDAMMRDCGPHMRKMYDTRQVIVDAGLDTHTKCLQRVNGTVNVTDGPFTEAKEMIGGAILIDAVDMEDAIRVAKLHPTTQVPVGEQFGWRMEIRPLHYFEMPDRDSAVTTATNSK